MLRERQFVVEMPDISLAHSRWGTSQSQQKRDN